MPPMPPRDKDVAARARSVRAVLSFVDLVENPVICLAPEGGDMPGGRLAYPPAGAGRLMLQLASKVLEFVPVGVWEQDGYLYVNFGPKFELLIPSGMASNEKDRLVATTVMRKIALLLPAYLRGEFQ